jgi:general secretion pathway protein D
MTTQILLRQSAIWVLMAAALAGCAQTAHQIRVNPDKMQRDASYIENEEAVATEITNQTTNLRRLPPASGSQKLGTQPAELAAVFSQRDEKIVAANELPLREFIQVVFGEQLGVNYIVTDPSLSTQTVTLNLQQPISSRKLFELTAQILDEQGIEITAKDNIYYLQRKQAQGAANVIIGLGRRPADVPETTSAILQIVPLKYGVKTSLERTLRSLTSARFTADIEQGALFVEGNRAEVLRIVDLVNLLDTPANRGRHIGFLELVYLNPTEFIAKLTSLMGAEGIPVSASAAAGPALLALPVEQIGAVALFANDEAVLLRAEFWASTLDKPAQNNERRYYIYHPRYARAADLGASVAPLIGSNLQGGGRATTARDTQSAQNNQQPATSSRASGGRSESGVSSAEGEDVRLTVDERSNTLVFYTSGQTYQSLLPIIKRLDILPKQILLDATIAEITLTDEFAQGFEFAFRSGKLTGGTFDSFGVGDMGGFRLNWTDGVSQILARLSASTSLVNILSNPTLVVRDGVNATITVGNDIPTVGATTINPGTETQSTTVVYRKTGVTLSVTPTINAQGLVVLEIDQQISNTSSSGPQLQGSPSIFERNIKTEVIAQSGQTVLLGGLISENNTDGSSHVPGISRVPLLGQLFKGQEQRKEKTELVIFITPRVIDSLDQWPEIRARIAEGLTSIQLVD